MSFSLEVFLENWVSSKGKLTTVIPPQVPAHETSAMVLDNARSTMFDALLEYEGTEAAGRSLVYTLNPTGVHNKEHVAKGMLKLAPLTTIGNLSGEKKGNSIALKVDATTTVYASGTPQPSELSGCNKFVYIPFWYVKTTSDATIANMRYASAKVDDDLAVTILQNTRALAPFERLLVFQEKAQAKAPLRGAIVPDPKAPPVAKAAPAAAAETVPPAVPAAKAGRGRGKRSASEPKAAPKKKGGKGK